MDADAMKARRPCDCGLETAEILRHRSPIPYWIIPVRADAECPVSVEDAKSTASHGFYSPDPYLVRRKIGAGPEQSKSRFLSHCYGGTTSGK
jgi:hypothetical protein